MFLIRNKMNTGIECIDGPYQIKCAAHSTLFAINKSLEVHT